jgi:hypothetical protein
MKSDQIISHITDDMGNDVLLPMSLDHEYDALCAVAQAAELEHRAHCLLLSKNCPICKALANLDEIRLAQHQAGSSEA